MDQWSSGPVDRWTGGAARAGRCVARRCGGRTPPRVRTQQVPHVRPIGRTQRGEARSRRRADAGRTHRRRRHQQRRLLLRARWASEAALRSRVGVQRPKPWQSLSRALSAERAAPAAPAAHRACPSPRAARLLRPRSRALRTARSGCARSAQPRGVVAVHAPIARHAKTDRAARGRRVRTLGAGLACATLHVAPTAQHSRHASRAWHRASERTDLEISVRRPPRAYQRATAADRPAPSHDDPWPSFDPVGVNFGRWSESRHQQSRLTFCSLPAKTFDVVALLVIWSRRCGVHAEAWRQYARPGGGHGVWAAAPRACAGGKPRQLPVGAACLARAHSPLLHLARRAAVSLLLALSMHCAAAPVGSARSAPRSPPVGTAHRAHALTPLLHVTRRAAASLQLVSSVRCVAAPPGSTFRV